MKFFTGYSRCFKSLVDLKTHFDQAVKAIKIGSRIDKDKRLFSYEDYALYHFMELCSREDLKSFCHPSVLTLADYDRRNKTDYVKSLFESISNEKGKVGSARALHIHRNTMNYRMSKIREIMGVNLNDRKKLFHIYFSLLILEYIGEVELV